MTPTTISNGVPGSLMLCYINEDQKLVPVSNTVVSFEQLESALVEEATAKGIKEEEDSFDSIPTVCEPKNNVALELKSESQDPVDVVIASATEESLPFAVKLEPINNFGTPALEATAQNETKENIKKLCCKKSPLKSEVSSASYSRIISQIWWVQLFY